MSLSPPGGPGDVGRTTIRAEFSRAKDYAKGAMQLAGLYPQVHKMNWRRTVRNTDLLTPWNRSHNAIFIHIPKNAGMSIYEMFGMEVGEHGTHVPAFVYESADPAFFRSAMKFCVIRNPWDRMVSAFHFLPTSPWPDDREWSARHLCGMESFSNFLRALEHPVYRSRILTRVHFHPQSRFVTDLSERLAVDHLVEFSRLNDGLHDIARKLGAPFMETRKNTSDHADYREYYDARGRRLVEKLYRRDIELFGYSF